MVEAAAGGGRDRADGAGGRPAPRWRTGDGWRGREAAARDWLEGRYAEAADGRSEPGDVAFMALGRERRLALVTPDRPEDATRLLARGTRAPRRRRPSGGLGPVDVLVRHGGGVERLDPNRLILWVLREPGALAALAPAPGVTGLLAAGPALVYETDEVALALTPDEVAGVAGRELAPDEAVRLAAAFGVFHEVHDDFYDPASWEALQGTGARDRWREATRGRRHPAWT